MNYLRLITLAVLFSALTLTSAWTQQKTSPGGNAALRYWAAFAQMQDSAVSDEQAKKMNSVMDGSAPYDDLEFKELVEKNRPALEIMIRATALPNCDWGLDYQMGPETPQEYVRKALILGRLNVLYAFHLLANGDKDRAANALAAGVRFARDVASGGTLFAALVAKSLLMAHLRAIGVTWHAGGLSRSQSSMLQAAVAQLDPDGLDWRLAMKRELEVPRELNQESASALAKIVPLYLEALDNPARLPDLKRMIASAPRQCADTIPNPDRVLRAKQELTGKLREIHSTLE